MIKVFEIIALIISGAAFGYGAFYLFRPEVAKFFRLYVCAAGCYMLEELWVIVNSLLGNGNADGLVTVRLFGFFGCLCFMLSANINEFDRVIDDGRSKRARLVALMAPAMLVMIFAVYVLTASQGENIAMVVTGFISILPAVPASYFCLKHLLLPEDSMGFLKAIKALDIMALVFFAVNYIYPLADIYCSRNVMGIFDVTSGIIMFVIMVCCRKGAEEWKTLI